MWNLFSYIDGKVAKNLIWFIEEFFLIVVKFCRFLFCRICFYRNIFLGVRDKFWKVEKKIFDLGFIYSKVDWNKFLLNV